MELTSKVLLKKISSFSIIGAFTTLLGILFNFVLVKYFFLDPIHVYLFIYVLSIFISYQLNIKYTFNSQYSKEGLIYYAIIYISSAIVGMVIMWLLKQYSLIPEYYYIFIVLPITVIWNFLLSYSKLDKANQSSTVI